MDFALTSQAAPVTNIFAGAEYQPPRDEDRLVTQIKCVYLVSIDGQWRTVSKLAKVLRSRYPHINFPENSVQAQLRNLRKLGFIVERQNAAERGCLWEYKLLAPVNPGVGAERRKAVLGVEANA